MKTGRPKEVNRIIRTYGDGSVLVGVSTPKFPEARMRIDLEDWKYIQSLGLGRAHASSSKGVLYAYCRDSQKKKNYPIHRLLLPKAEMIDHRNHNGLDNRRSKIRACSQSQNCMNRKLHSNNISGTTGVRWNKRRGCWVARISAKGKGHFLGYFKVEGKAIQARKEAEQKYFGEFAYKN